MDKEEINIQILNDYTEYPGPRYCTQGSNSGEDFYHKKLNEIFHNAISQEKNITIILDGTAGYASSFLDEAIGNLVYDFSKHYVLKYLKIVSLEEPDWEKMIFNEIIPEWSKRRQQKKEPRKTIQHEEWYRLVDSNFVKKEW